MGMRTTLEIAQGRRLTKKGCRVIGLVCVSDYRFGFGLFVLQRRFVHEEHRIT